MHARAIPSAAELAGLAAPSVPLANIAAELRRLGARTSQLQSTIGPVVPALAAIDGAEQTGAALLALQDLDAITQTLDALAEFAEAMCNNGGREACQAEGRIALAGLSARLRMHPLAPGSHADADAGELLLL